MTKARRTGIRDGKRIIGKLRENLAQVRIIFLSVFLACI